MPVTTEEMRPPQSAARLTALRPRFAWVTWTIVVTTALVFLRQLFLAGRYHEDVLGNQLACSPEALADGRYWTLLTYAWAHATALFGHPDLFWLHIVANMVPLICLGPALEDFLGPMRFLGLYLGGAVIAALTWYVFNMNAEQGIIGASGAVFALIAAAGTAAPRTSVIVYVLFILPIRMSLRVLAIVACGIEAAQVLFNWMPDVAHSAHLGGAAFGVLYIVVTRSMARNLPQLA